jgi:hypothetical protein
MGVDPFGEARGFGAVLHHGLHRPHGVAGVAIALEQVALAADLQVGAQLLRQGRQDRHVAAGLALGVGEVDPGRVVVQIQVLDPDVDELAEPRPREEQRLDQQPVLAVIAVGAGDEALHFGPVERLDRTGARGWRRQPEPAAYPLDDVLGLVIVEVVLAPEPGGLANDLSEVATGSRLR